MKKRLSWLIIGVLALALLGAGCAQQEAASEDLGSFAIVKGGEEHMVSVTDLIEGYEPVELDVTSVDSSGDVNEYRVKGVRLDDVLADLGITDADYDSMRAAAGDGYAIEVPAEIVALRDIVLAYEINGEALPEDTKPIRLIVPEERSMYWVRNMETLELLNTQVASEVDTVVLLETAAADLPLEPYTYYESEDSAFPMTALLEAYGTESEEDLYFRAVDGFEKEETRANVELGYLKVTGEERPLFLSPDLPKGMHIKQILLMRQDNVCVYSLESAAGLHEQMTIGEEAGIPLVGVLADTGLADAEAYELVARDGYRVEVDADTLRSGMAYFKKDTWRTLFPGEDKSTKVKEILIIRALGADDQ